MKKTIKIRIIKKAHKKQFGDKLPVAEISGPRNVERQMVSTITDWVKQFQKRRGEETKEAFRYHYEKCLRPVPTAEAS